MRSSCCYLQKMILMQHQSQLPLGSCWVLMPQPAEQLRKRKPKKIRFPELEQVPWYSRTTYEQPWVLQNLMLQQQEEQGRKEHEPWLQQLFVPLTEILIIMLCGAMRSVMSLFNFWFRFCLCTYVDPQPLAFCFNNRRDNNLGHQTARYAILVSLLFNYIFNP